MVHKTWQNATDSPYPKKTVVTEIDSSPPFQSVKDAIAQFDEVSISEEKPAVKKAKPHSAERVFAQEAQLHLAQKELSKWKEQLKDEETTKAEALVELENAKRTVHDFTQKLKACGESRKLETKVNEAARSQAKQFDKTNSGEPDGINVSWKEELETAVKRYASVVIELVHAKHELWKMRHEYNSAFEARVSSFKKVEEDDDVMNMNTENASELFKEISAVQQLEGIS
ncbi:hypothetical protein QN277_016148 [Acacia crassicarpa]|uniref:Uncharacterized protein n=1 Tax=Acacia crassicarpa TaxID=499986 RepID=A0AAE1TAK0_9FABA|nr:hypothetical protein QN277_016148 [Acacia crassicarpa]